MCIPSGLWYASICPYGKGRKKSHSMSQGKGNFPYDCDYHVSGLPDELAYVSYGRTTKVLYEASHCLVVAQISFWELCNLG